MKKITGTVDLRFDSFALAACCNPILQRQSLTEIFPQFSNGGVQTLIEMMPTSETIDWLEKPRR